MLSAISPQVVARPKVAVLTTREINPMTGYYYQQEDAKALESAKMQDSFREVPYLYHERQRDDGKLASEMFIGENDNIEDQTVVRDKIDMLFPGSVSGSLLGEAVLYVHGFNCSPEGAKMDAEEIYGITGKPVIVFDWASTHNYPLIGNSVIPFVAKGYAKDAEAATLSVRPMNWILYVLLRGIEKLHIVSHSMGARILMWSISDLSHDYRLTKKFQRDDFSDTQQRMLERLGIVVLKEPDADILSTSKFVHRDMYDIHSANNSTCVVVYAHEHDNPLGLSQGVHYNIQRVGQLCGAEQLLEVLRPNVPDYFYAINATPCEGNIISRLSPNANHSYWECGRFRSSLADIINHGPTTGLQNDVINTM
jgi:esterase/lipase superfamily enzyme